MMTGLGRLGLLVLMLVWIRDGNGIDAPELTQPKLATLLDDVVPGNANKKFILLPDAIENATSPDVEFRLFQQKVLLDFSELGPLKVQDPSQTSPTIGTWAIRLNPTSPWLNSTSPNVELGESSSVRLQEIHNPGLALLTLITTTKQPQQQVVLIKFVAPLPIAARLQLRVEAAKIFSTTVQDVLDSPFISVQDIFAVTMGVMPTKEVVDNANKAFATLPQSKTLQKKIADFSSSASTVPASLNPGVYLKPKTGYGLLATLEFRIVSDSGNTTKILYEQGDVYLHLTDRLRFLPKAPPPVSPAMPALPNDLEFYVRCWDGVSSAETSLGPIGELRINFDNFFGRRPQLKPNVTNGGQQRPKVVPTVPYAIDVDGQFQSGYSVGDLVEWFYAAPGGGGVMADWKPWTMGIGVLAAGTGDLGVWQYRNAGGWHDFPDNLKSGWKLFKSDQQSRGSFATTFGMADLKEKAQLQVLLLSPKLTIRFKPSKDDSFWSATDAFRQNAFSFLAWQPTSNGNVSSTTDVTAADLDTPDCKICNDLGISKEGVTICAERFGCDGKISSTAQFDQCGVCAGPNECLDCRKVPRGAAKWVCGICTEDGSYLKDCRGVCNGTYQRSSSGECVDPDNEPKGCDGEYHSSAVLNDCGICVLGRTGKPANYAKDQCGVCNGTNTCVGCDGQPNSGKTLDICGVCRQANEDGFNKGCGARLSEIQPRVASIVNATIRANASGLTSTTPVDCSLVLLSTFDPSASKSTTAREINSTQNVSTTLDSVKGTDLTSLTLRWDYVESPGVYGLKCKSAYKFDVQPSENGSSVFLVDYNILQLTNAEPSSIVLTGNQSMMVKITGTFIPTISRDPYCLGLDKKSNAVTSFPVEIRSTKEAYCNLASVTKSKALDLRLVQHTDALAEISAKQRPVTVVFKARAPKASMAKFGDGALEVVVKFDVNSMANGGDCQQIFDDGVVAKLGNQPSCRFSADQLHVILGSNHQINVNDQIRFKPNAIYQADAEYYEYLSPSEQQLLSIDAPDQKLTPAISIDSPTTISMCSEQVRLAVRKATGDGGRAMTYQWTVSKAEKTSSKETVLIPPELRQISQSTQSDTLVIPTSILINDVSYTFQIVACNFLKECSPAGELRLNVGNYTDTQLIVQTLGLDPPVRCGSKRQLRAAATLKICDTLKPLTTNLLFHWEVRTNQTVTATGNDWTFVLPSNDVEPGQHAQVKVQAFYDHQPNDRNLTAEATLDVIYEAQPLWVRLGATTRKQGIAEDLVLDGSASMDPNRKVQHLDHTWTCSRVDPQSPNDPSKSTPCYVSNSSKTLFEEVFNMNHATITVPAQTFEIGVYNFTDTIRSGTLDGSDTVMVTLVPGRVPLVEMLPSLAHKPSGDQAITFRANVHALENVTVAIVFVETQGYGNVTLPDDLKQLTRVDVPSSVIGPGGYVFSFTLPPALSPQYPNWTGLAPKTMYAARVVANTTSGLVGESFVSFVTDEPPTMGTLTMSTIPADLAIYALSTVLRLTAKGFMDHLEDMPLSYQFGIRTHSVDGSSMDDWFPATAVEESNIYLASAESSRPTCSRVGYQALVKVCDLHGACTKAVAPSQPFQVQPPQNLTAAIEDLVQEIQIDLYDGNGFGASMKMGAIVAQRCGRLVSEKSEGATQAVAAHILGRLTPTSDKEDLVAATRVANDLLLRPNCTIPVGVLEKLKQAIQGLEASMGVSGGDEVSNGSTINAKKRKKRQTSLATQSQTPVDVDSATQLLGAYEIIVQHSNDPESVSVYLKGTQDLLNQMCLGRDATQSPMMVSSKGSARPLCVIEARGLFIDPSVVNRNISIATSDKTRGAQLQIGSGLEETYTLWSCNEGKSTCTSICLATAVYYADVDSSDSSPIGDYVFRNGTLSRSLSDIHLVGFVDPISKQALSIKRPDWERYTLLVPLTRTGSSGYYACKSYVQSPQDWTTMYCDAIGTKTMSSGQIYVACQCRLFGYVAVFDAPPPAAPTIAPNQPVTVSFVIDQFDASKFASTEDLSNSTLTWLADRLNTSTRRIVDLELKKAPTDAFGVGSSSGSAANSRRLISFVLRPPSHWDRTETSRLLMRINGTSSAAVDSNTAASGGSVQWLVIAQSMVYAPTKRDLKNDADARMVTIRILDDYDRTVGKSGSEALVSTLTTQLSIILNISRTRITDMNFQKGSTIANFILQSLGSKSSEISSELASVILLEQIRYEELSLVDANANALSIDPNGTVIQVVEIKPGQAASDTLPIIIGGTVGAAFFIVIVFVIALVVIKNRGRRDKVSPFTSTESSPNGSQRNSAQTTVNVRRISITDDQNGSSLRSRRT